MDKRKTTPRVTPRVTKKEAAYIRALRAEGMPILRIAKLTKRSPSTVKKHAAPLEPVAPPPAEPVVAPYVPTLPPQDGIIARIRKWIFGV